MTKSNKTSSLFVGRWQPFHRGHKTLIETVLKEGKPVVIAIRDTEMSHKNPIQFLKGGT
ncbi:MAG: sulfate adenylyltransferase subunit 1/adenylylsulfate kinase [Candidatus Daviesbacteria bacterium GW2011_GWA1_36_8]|uniref:Sulfate adenylyltransferase subunit 1/adenylylsulfate kinase n=2 Tax=Candidatus Daviesiibacteriota TaxID=1752718 RepID=A0A0G0F218_9BACT|nr:MAG: sulfate adenylyltransferase subunit 1/adenylylsulfate kinase [Candidatus Daviesbacteria bacterium GW2011_GWB1_36_5]KKQ15226.1 MAG: sulfate adenylyltransferase subunit 1/adenylylsulfate kinase [Candidatus Daviesbacteria bacterium GW2011_GWA1_36_8]